MCIQAGSPFRLKIRKTRKTSTIHCKHTHYWYTLLATSPLATINHLLSPGEQDMVLVMAGRGVVGSKHKFLHKLTPPKLENFKTLAIFGTERVKTILQTDTEYCTFQLYIPYALWLDYRRWNGHFSLLDKPGKIGFLAYLFNVFPTVNEALFPFLIWWLQ